MPDYDSLDNEELVALYQAGNQAAFEPLFKRFEGLLRSWAWNSSQMNRAIGFDEFFSRYSWKFLRAAQKYRGRGALGRPFADFLLMVLGNRHWQRKQRDTSLEVMPPMPDYRQQHEYLVQETDTECFRYVASKSAKLGRALELKLQGYTYDEIAGLMGYRGKGSTRRMKIKRLFERIQVRAQEYLQLSEVA